MKESQAIASTHNFDGHMQGQTTGCGRGHRRGREEDDFTILILTNQSSL